MTGQLDIDISFTERAAAKVRALIADEENADLKLRVFITGGDAVVEREGVSMLVDSLSYQYLLGAEVDYKEGLQGAQFVVQNPNASATCGCGNSFAI